MPIYEYQAVRPDKGCRHCGRAFEVLQALQEPPLRRCPRCGAEIKKLVSLSHAVVVETPEKTRQTERKIRAYERSGMWSHAAELADAHAEKTKDKRLKARAKEAYRKAGYDIS